MNIFQKIPIQANILTFLFFHNLSLLFPEDSQDFFSLSPGCLVNGPQKQKDKKTDSQEIGRASCRERV